MYGMLDESSMFRAFQNFTWTIKHITYLPSKK